MHKIHYILRISTRLNLRKIHPKKNNVVQRVDVSDGLAFADPFISPSHILDVEFVENNSSTNLSKKESFGVRRSFTAPDFLIRSLSPMELPALYVPFPNKA